MDEVQLAMLKANGYNYIHGALVDSEENYLPTLELNGQSFTSESDEDLFNEIVELDLKNSYKISPEEEIKNYENNPINNTLSKKTKDYYPIHSGIPNKKILKTNNTLVIDNDSKISISTIYQYPIVLGASIVLYLIIKRITK